MKIMVPMDNKVKIPRIIHYCWFGRGNKSKKIVKCLKSWEVHLKDFEVMEWNEDNFDIRSNQFVQEAYEAKKYAFVSDYVRLHALYHYGGIYLDTDVEILKDLSPFLNHDAFFGFEDDQYISTGLMAVSKRHDWIRELLNEYNHKQFSLSNGTSDMTTITKIVTEHFLRHGLKLSGDYQTLENGVAVYPRTFFCPYDYINGSSYLTKNSYAIHHFAKSWLPAHVRWRGEIKRLMGHYVGPQVISKMRDMILGK